MLQVAGEGDGIRDRPISRASSWQNPSGEHLFGTLRRECLDGMLVFGEVHLRSGDGRVTFVGVLD
jgi:hypothetical protein